MNRGIRIVISLLLALAKHQKDLLVGLAARPGGPVEVAAVRGDGPLGSDAVRVDIDGREVPTESCGTGCSSTSI